MKEIILQFLLENTEVEGRYIGGGEEPQIITFPESEDWDKNDFCNTLSERLEALLRSNEADA
jgi:hypothetical protein